MRKKRYLGCVFAFLIGMGICGFTGASTFAAQTAPSLPQEGYFYRFQASDTIRESGIVLRTPTLRNVSLSDEARFVSQIESNEVALSVYRALETHIEELKTGTASIPFQVSSSVAYRSADFGRDLQAGIDAFDRDYSEVFWIDVTKMMFVALPSVNGSKISAEIRLVPGYHNYYSSDYSSKAEVLRDIARMDARIEELKNRATGSDYDKLKFFHDYLIEKNEYNTLVYYHRDLADTSPKAWKITSALYYGSTDKNNMDNPVCEGYARAFKVLCDAVGIPNVLISGESQGEGHMWNYVKLDGKWYAVDVTWDDPLYFYVPSDAVRLKNQYEFFLKGSSNFPDHKSDGQFLPPDGYTFMYPTLSIGDYDPSQIDRQTDSSVQAGAASLPAGAENLSVVKTPTVSMEMTLGYKKSKTIRIYNLQDDAEIAYQSSDKSIVQVNSNGKITGLKKGKAIITMHVSQGGKSFTLQTVVTCK